MNRTNKNAKIKGDKRWKYAKSKEENLSSTIIGRKAQKVDEVRLLCVFDDDVDFSSI